MVLSVLQFYLPFLNPVFFFGGLVALIMSWVYIYYGAQVFGGPLYRKVLFIVGIVAMIIISVFIFPFGDYEGPQTLIWIAANLTIILYFVVIISGYTILQRWKILKIFGAIALITGIGGIYLVFSCSEWECFVAVALAGLGIGGSGVVFLIMLPIIAYRTMIKGDKKRKHS